MGCDDNILHCEVFSELSSSDFYKPPLTVPVAEVCSSDEHVPGRHTETPLTMRKPVFDPSSHTCLGATHLNLGAFICTFIPSPTG